MKNTLKIAAIIYGTTIVIRECMRVSLAAGYIIGKFETEEKYLKHKEES